MSGSAYRSPLAKEYFAGSPVLRTSDLDEARQRVSRVLCDHRLTVQGKGAGLSVCHNAVRGRHVAISYLSYGAKVMVNPGRLESFYLFHLPLSGHARLHHRGGETVTAIQTAAILNPDRTARLEWSEGCRKLLLQIDRVHMENVARSLTGAPLPGPIRFETDVDLTTRAGGRLKHLITVCAEAAEAGYLFKDATGEDSLRIEHDLALALLTLQPSNISHIIERSDRSAKPRAIKTALDFMHANLSETVTLSDIADAAHVNVRTLQKGFQRAFGRSPMQVLRDVRLDKARYLLSARQDPPTVTEVAYICGFSHLSRFSIVFKQRFGHLPSERV